MEKDPPRRELLNVSSTTEPIRCCIGSVVELIFSSTTEPIRHRIGSVVELIFNKSVIPRVHLVGLAMSALP